MLTSKYTGITGYSNTGNYLLWNNGAVMCLLNTSTGKNVMLNEATEMQWFTTKNADVLLYKKGSAIFATFAVSNQTKLIASSSDKYWVYAGAKPIVLYHTSGILFRYELPVGKSAKLGAAVPDAAPVIDLPTGSIAWLEKKGGQQYLNYFDGTVHRVPVDSTAGDIRFAGESILFSVQNPAGRPAASETGSDLWDYRQTDVQLPSFNQSGYKERLLYACSVISGKVMPVEQADDALVDSRYGTKNYLLARRDHRRFEFYWRKDAWESLYLVSVRDGSRKTIFEKLHQKIEQVSLSPDERYVTWFNMAEGQWFSYEVQRGITRNITKAVPVPLWNKDADILSDRVPYEPAGWLKNDAAILLYDKNDLWQIDPSGRQSPVCLTNNYGKQHQIVFRLAADPAKPGIYKKGERLILAALDEQTMDNGFWFAQTGIPQDPDKRIMGPYMYCWSDLYDGTIGSLGGGGSVPEKLKAANKWIVTRENLKGGKQTFLTSDFKSCQLIDSNPPPGQYNWLSSELIRYRLPDGKESRAILYKPENFDSTKRYPVIFKYYERRAAELNLFLQPAFAIGELDVPYMVSNGYLVCVPDIYYQTGSPGQGIVNSVEAAAKYLNKHPWVDSTRLGIQGFSYGGYETNVLLTRSKLFAAACESAGPSDQVSNYNALLGLNYKGPSRQSAFEEGQNNLVVPPYADPERYLENSPVFYINKIITPLLIMHNREDASVPFGQALEMFLSMRRASKPVWMLQYDGHGHGVSGEAAKDYTIKMKEFFDHYLMDKALPEWMNRYRE